MTADRLLYRARQFWLALAPSAQAKDLERAAQVLSGPQIALFASMPAGEQAHALRVLRVLQERGEHDPDLLAAALLHDVGKIRFPLAPWERALIVIIQAICPACLERWGRAAGKESQGEAVAGYGWRRPFVVAVQHPAWGAQLAGSAGASPGVVVLIRRHQEALARPGNSPESVENRRLRALQAADNNS